MYCLMGFCSTYRSNKGLCRAVKECFGSLGAIRCKALNTSIGLKQDRICATSFEGISMGMRDWIPMYFVRMETISLRAIEAPSSSH